MNILNLNPFYNFKINNNNNYRKNHFNNNYGLKCDTVSFGASWEKLKYDDVLIYHEEFDSNYEAVSRDNQINIDKKLEEIKRNNQLTNANHGIAGVPGLFEVTSKGSNAYRIYFKIIDGSLVVISCSQKNLSDKVVDRIYEKIREIVKSGELEDFVAQHKEELKKAQEAQEQELQANEQKLISRKKELKSNVVSAKNQLIKKYLEPAEVNAGIFQENKKDYRGDIEELNKFSEEIQKKFTELKNSIDGLKFENSDDETTVENKIDEKNKEVARIFAEFDKLIEDALFFIDENSVTKVNSTIAKIEAMKVDISSIFKEIKSKIKEIQSSPNFNKQNIYYEDLIEIQKKFNTDIKRQAETIARFGKNTSINEASDKYTQMSELNEKAYELYSEFEEKIKAYNATKLMSAVSIKSKTKAKKAQETIVASAGAPSKPEANKEAGETTPERTDYSGRIQPKETPDISTHRTKTTYVTMPQDKTVRICKYPRFELSEYSKKVFEKIEKDLSETMLPACAKNISTMLINHIGQDKLANLNKLNEIEFVELITSAMSEISKTAQYQTSLRAMNIAFLNEISLCSTIEADKLYNLPSSQIDKLYKGVSKGEKTFTLVDEFNQEFNLKLDGTPDLEETEAYYKTLIEPLCLAKLEINFNDSLDIENITTYLNNITQTEGNSEIAALIEIISEYAPDIDKNKLKNYLSQQGAYLNLLADKTTPKALKDRLLKYVFGDFDRIYGTNHTKFVLKQIDKEKIERRVNLFTSDEILGTIDF